MDTNGDNCSSNDNLSCGSDTVNRNGRDSVFVHGRYQTPVGERGTESSKARGEASEKGSEAFAKIAAKTADVECRIPARVVRYGRLG